MMNAIGSAMGGVRAAMSANAKRSSASGSASAKPRKKVTVVSSAGKTDRQGSIKSSIARAAAASAGRMLSR